MKGRTAIELLEMGTLNLGPVEFAVSNISGKERDSMFFM